MLIILYNTDFFLDFFKGGKVLLNFINTFLDGTKLIDIFNNFAFNF